MHRCLTHFGPAVSNSVITKFNNHPNDYVMPGDTHRHVIHLKKHIFAYIRRCLSYVAIAMKSAEMGGGGGGID